MKTFKQLIKEDYDVNQESYENGSRQVIISSLNGEDLSGYEGSYNIDLIDNASGKKIKLKNVSPKKTEEVKKAWLNKASHPLIK